MEKKRTIWQAMICVVLVCLIWGGYFLLRGSIDKKNEENRVRELKVELDRTVLSQIEQVNVKDGDLIISGWALRLNSENKSAYIILKSAENEEDIVIQANCSERADVSSIIENDYDFGEIGFTAKLMENKLKNDVSYEIFIVLAYEEKENQVQQKKITTNRYLYNGELYRYCPEKFEEPGIEITEIKEVVNNENLYGYDLETGGWIYEYQGTMYWILNAKQFEELTSIPSVPIAIYPLHEEQVPEERREIYYEKGYDYFEIYLSEDYQIKSENEVYYVCSLQLPNYPFVHIRTGSYGNGGTGWIYKEEFQMDLMK